MLIPRGLRHEEFINKLVNMETQPLIMTHCPTISTLKEPRSMEINQLHRIIK